MIDDFIIRKKKRGAEAEEAGGGWKIALADFMCALMITFFSLWAIGQQDKQSIKELADYFKGETIDIEKKMNLIDDTFEEVEKILEEQGLKVTMEKNKRGIVIKFDSSSLFESGSAELKDNAFEALRALAIATNHTSLFYHTYGYSDRTPVRRGSEIENNLLLSIMRATSAARAILDGGVNSNRVTIHGEGELNPEDPSFTSEAYAKNRRVELYMSYSSAPHKIYGENVSYTDLDNVDEINHEAIME